MNPALKTSIAIAVILGFFVNVDISVVTGDWVGSIIPLLLAIFACYALRKSATPAY